MPGTAIRFKNPYQNYNPSTIFQVDPATKTLSPFGSGEPYTQAGFQFGQERLVEDPNEFQGFGVGPIINSRAAGLQQVTQNLNQLQQNEFSQQTQAPKRAAATLQEQIDAGTKGVADAMAEYNSLVEKYKNFQQPNYQQSYLDARTQAGIHGLEQDFVGVRQQRRELPYVQRAGSGNAGVMTEGQLGANVQQADIPLEAREANLIDRLQLASDFVNQSLRFKELDANTARTALENAINLVTQGISLQRTGLEDARSQRDQQQARADAALQFRLENNITTPFFNVGGTIYDSGSLEGIPDEKTFQQKYAMTLQDAEAKGLVGKIDANKKTEQTLVLDMAGTYKDAGILPSDTLQQAQAKLQNSRIYREQVRLPLEAGGGGSGSSFTVPGIGNLTNTQIDNINPLVTAFQNSDITKTYNTIAEGYSFINSLSDKTTNPSDDQALIYAFAKAMDPGSVVREGEYATVQKYAQSWAQAYGKSFNQALNGTGFLSETARKNIKDTIRNRYQTSQQSYNNLVKETGRRIELVAGLHGGTGTKYLNNYAAGYAQVQPNFGANFTGPTQPGQNTQASAAPAAPLKPSEQVGNFLNRVGNWLFGDD